MTDESIINTIAEEEIIVGREGDFPLEGLLTMPAQRKSQLPAVVLVHGSGANDLNQTIYFNRPFKDIANYLAAHGIAGVRYNKRNFTYGEKMLGKARDITVKSETIEDAILASNLLRRHPAIDPHRIFLVGHSLGGMLAPRIDASGGNFAGLIIMAGSPRNLWQILRDQNDNVMAKLADGFRKRRLAKKLAKEAAIMQDFTAMTDEEAQKRRVFNHYFAYYFKEMADHPTEKYLAQLNKPLLIMQGEADFQVFADKDFKLYQQLLADNPQVTFKLYPQLNHFFMPAGDGTIREYYKKANVDEAVLFDLVYWIKKTPSR
ncbi:MAG: alpha/beta hydrolase family protein [Bacillota bacterium]|jgi:dienelactone hydrolase